jgi:glucose/mannose transport system substrate-binding protein
MFKQKDPAAQKARRPGRNRDEQELPGSFNLNKGSIPARLDTPMDKFDDCAKKSKADLTPPPRAAAWCQLRPRHGHAIGHQGA